MKKLFSMLLVLAIAASSMALTSCGEKKTNSSEDESKVVSSDISAEISADASTDVSTDVSTDNSQMAIEDTETYKAAESIDATNGVTIKMISGVNSVAFYMKDDATCEETVLKGKEGDIVEKVITKDGKIYTLDPQNKTYTVVDASAIGQEMGGVLDYILDGAVYKTTTTEEIDGISYTVDVFSDSQTGMLEIKIYVENGTIKMVSFLGQVFGFEITTSVPDGIFELPEGYTEVAE